MNKLRNVSLRASKKKTNPKPLMAITQTFLLLAMAT